MSAEGEVMSKSAKKRAAKKANKAAAEEEVVAPTPVPPKANQAKAKPAVQPASPPQATPKPEAKSKAKAAPKPETKPEPAPPPKPAKVEAKASAKGKAKANAKQAAKPEIDHEAELRRKEDVNDFTVFDEWDDGTGGEWSFATGTSAKNARQAEKKNAEKARKAELDKMGKVGASQHVPGLTQAAGQHIVGMGPATKGASQAVAATQAQMKAFEEKRALEAAAAEQAANGLRSMSIEVPEAKAGQVIGPGGKMIKLIQEKCNVKIDTSGGEFTINGPEEGVKDAHQAIKDIITKGYTQLMYEDFEDSSVMVYPTNFPDLIGKKGATIILLKKALEVEVRFPDTKNAKQNKKVKVPIAGKKENVDKAKEVIESIIKYGHHEITHPGEVHDEVEVEDWCYAAIIGKKGSELRHIQNSFKCRVMIPRDTSECPNVVVVGDPVGVPKAKAYIEKTVYNFASGIRGGRDRGEQATDGWGDEEPMEAWMETYIYKR